MNAACNVPFEVSKTLCRCTFSVNYGEYKSWERLWVRYIKCNKSSVAELIRNKIRKKMFISLFVCAFLEFSGYFLYLKFNTLMSNLMVIFFYILVLPILFFLAKLSLAFMRLYMKWEHVRPWDELNQKIMLWRDLLGAGMMGLYNIYIIFKLIIQLGGCNG